MRACHVRDGAALIEYFAWLEDRLINHKENIDEVKGADKLESIRSYEFCSILAIVKLNLVGSMRDLLVYHLIPSLLPEQMQPSFTINQKGETVQTLIRMLFTYAIREASTMMGQPIRQELSTLGSQLTWSEKLTH